MFKPKALMATAFTLGAFCCSAAFATTNYAEREDAKAMIDQLASEGLDADRIRTLLEGAERKESILEAIARPAEKTMTWARYQKIFIQQTRIDQGIEFSKEMKESLQRASEQYGVPEEMILAIIGIETRYGRNMGSFRVVDALATLGFDYPPRATFFRKQLAELFRLEQKAHIDASTIKGSYAGAMGYGQFIPSSYIHYSVDFDNDGVTDLVNNPVDAVGSVANYFAEHGWTTGLPIAARARVSGDQWQSVVQDKRKPEQTLGSLKAAGVTPVSCQESNHCFEGLSDDTPVALFEFEGTNGMEYWIATNNFYTITRYNHSTLYGMAAYQLSELIKEAL